MKNNRISSRVARTEAAAQLKNLIKDYAIFIRDWVTDNTKGLIPVVLLILVIVTFFIAISARGRVEAATVEADSIIEDTRVEVQEVTELPFEVDAYPGVNELVERYFDVIRDADVEGLDLIQSNVTSTEGIRLNKMSEYIDRYENIKVYTKPGPYANTFVAYVYNDIYLKGRDEGIPGLQAFYICCDDLGNYYINNGELTEKESEYLENIVLQSDVVDLKNSVTVAYNSVMEANESLSRYWAKVSVEIDTAVSNSLALEAKLVAQLEEASQEEEEETGDETPKIIQVKTTAYVNLRKSASSGADIIDQVPTGTVLDVIERMNNGWTLVTYKNSEGYVSNDYLEEIEDLSSYETTGKVTATTLLNVRSEPDAGSNKIGVLNEGQTVDLIETVDGWCKIKFSGQIGYVKAEYVK